MDAFFQESIQLPTHLRFFVSQKQFDIYTDILENVLHTHVPKDNDTGI